MNIYLVINVTVEEGFSIYVIQYYRHTYALARIGFCSLKDEDGYFLEGTTIDQQQRGMHDGTSIIRKGEGEMKDVQLASSSSSSSSLLSLYVSVQLTSIVG